MRSFDDNNPNTRPPLTVNTAMQRRKRRARAAFLRTPRLKDKPKEK